MAKDVWTREQTIIAFNLYCKIPFSKATATNPAIIETAHVIGRSPDSLAMKIGNLGRFDPELRKLGIKGLAHGGKMDEIIWDEFNDDWEKLAYESEILLAKFQGKNLEEEVQKDDEEIQSLPEGKE